MGSVTNSVTLWSDRCPFNWFGTGGYPKILRHRINEVEKIGEVKEQGI